MNDYVSTESELNPELISEEEAGWSSRPGLTAELIEYPPEETGIDEPEQMESSIDAEENCGGGHEAEEGLALALNDSLASLGPNGNPLAVILEAIDPQRGEQVQTLRAGDIFNSFVYGESGASGARRYFEAVAYPGESVPASLQEGDVLLRRGPVGETYVAVLSSGELLTAEDLVGRDVLMESMRQNGRYAAVIEAAPFPHRVGENFYRRITNTGDVLTRNQLLLRPLEQEDGLEYSLDETIPSSGLRWNGASAAQLAFMRSVYDAHVARSSRRRTFQPDVPASQLGPIENGLQARRAAAQACRNMLAAARQAITRDSAARGRVTAVGITSGYRSATRQFNIWQRNFPRYYRETSAARQRQAGGQHGPAAVTLLARYIGQRVGAPGFSLHNAGLAIDLTTTENGTRLAAGTSAANIARWRQSWFYRWLSANAGGFNFYENTAINEPWHWQFRQGSTPTPPSPARTTTPTTTGIDWCQIRTTIALTAQNEERRWTRANGSKILESDPTRLPILERYWRATPGHSSAAAAASAAASSASNNLAWSAAFICFVMRSSGVQSTHGFEFSGRHLNYIVGALRNRERSDRNRVFWLADHIELQNEALPKPGDLLCFNRQVRGTMTTHSYSSLRRDFWLGGNQNRPVRGSSHCSVITAIVTRGDSRFVQFIGGNEGNSVRRREIQLNQAGGISNPGAHNIFGMIKIIDC